MQMLIRGVNVNFRRSMSEFERAGCVGFNQANSTHYIYGEPLACICWSGVYNYQMYDKWESGFFLSSGGWEDACARGLVYFKVTTYDCFTTTILNPSSHNQTAIQWDKTLVTSCICFFLQVLWHSPIVLSCPLWLPKVCLNTVLMVDSLSPFLCEFH